MPGALLRERHDVGEVIGEGAFGRTLAARDATTGAEVVLKLITIRGLPGWKEFEYFEREVAVLRSLNHPGVPRFVDAFQAEVEGSGPIMALVMERIRGESLAALIARGHRWEEASARALLEALLTTLDYLHRLSPIVIHRDIKPGNIVLRPNGEPVLVDFGAVRDWASRAGHGSLTVVGTPGYIAPEQAMGAAVPASDVFALGATMIHALTHCHPADLPRRGLRLVFADRLGCSRSMVAILERMVEPDLADRYASASDAIADLRRPLGALLEHNTALQDTKPDEALVPFTSDLEVPVDLDRFTTPRWITKSVSAYLDGQTRLKRSMIDLAALSLMVMTGIGGIVGMFFVCSLFPATDMGALYFFFLPAFIAAAAAIRAGARSIAERMSQRLESLYRDGTAARAKVLLVQPRSSGTDLYQTVTYEYEVDGARHRGTLETSAGAPTVEVGDDNVLVIHDSKEHRRHLAMLLMSSSAAGGTLDRRLGD
jgi:serine/threonine protein kinase